MSRHPDPMFYEERSRVGRLMNQARNTMVNALDQALARFDITAAQYVVISTLAAGRAGSAAQICKELSYDPGAMTRMLDRLEHKNIIRREHSQADRRTTRLVLTEQGGALFPELLACYEMTVETFMGRFSSEEIAQMGSFLERILA